MKKGITLLEVILIIALAIFGAVVFTTKLTMSSESNARLVKCKANLDQIGKGMKIYLWDFGRNTLYPPAEGEEFLVTLYHMKILEEPNIYLCPNTPDANNNGADLVNVSGTGDASGPCSYAGRKNKDQKNYPGIIYAPTKDSTISPIAADDWNGGTEENHQQENLINFLFADGHSDHVRSKGFDFAKDYAEIYDPLTN